MLHLPRLCRYVVTLSTSATPPLGWLGSATGLLLLPASFVLPCVPAWLHVRPVVDYAHVLVAVSWKWSCVHILNGRHRHLIDMDLVVLDSILPNCRLLKHLILVRRLSAMAAPPRNLLSPNAVPLVGKVLLLMWAPTLDPPR